MTMDARQQRNRVVVTLHDCFDASDLRKLHEVLSEAPTGCPITLDFREVRLFHDAAVAQLARELSSAPEVSVVGLSEHHHRLLRYLGEGAAIA